MKKILMALALGLMMVSLIATPALAGSQPGIGMQKVYLPGNHGFVIFNVNQADDTISVNVVAKNLAEDADVTIWLRAGSGTSVVASQTVHTSGNGNVGYSFTLTRTPGSYQFNVKVDGLSATSPVTVQIYA